MEELFFKSALPACDPFLLDDSSLALPAEPNSRSSTKADSNDRSLRVHQQVQLTLARKARRSVSNGGVRLQGTAARSFDATDGVFPHTKVNGFGVPNCSFSSSEQMGRPSRRVEVSPPPSPEMASHRLGYNTRRFATYTFPGPIQTYRNGSLLHCSRRPDTFRHYAFSEAPRGTRLHPSTSTNGNFRRKSHRHTAGSQATFADMALQQMDDHECGWGGHDQSVFMEEELTMQGQNGDFQPNNELSWLARVRREGQGLRQLNSYPPTVISMEVDLRRPMEAEPTLQEAQTTDVTTLISKSKPPEMTLERAVNLLTQENEELLICAAGHIQSQCFKSADAKKMVYYLRGIGKLLQLLHSDSEEVQRVASGALRNVVYQSSENKMEVKENKGLATILQVLKSSRDVETRRHLTGLLWNLSSHDLLKAGLSREALSVLTKSILVPSSGISEGENPKDELLADAEVFHSATGCLRNLSSAGPDARKAMRECENLIDSLVYYVRGTIADYKTDDKSTENCVCILHNLSYQIESELPTKYTRDFRESQQNLAPKPKRLGCFTHRSAKITEELEHQRTLLEDNPNPSGMEWLWSSITIRMYLSLIARSVRHYTQEAAVGALQNLTAGNGVVTEAIAFTIVQRENGLQHVKKMLQEGESDVRRTAVALIKNLSRYRELHPDIVQHVLPELVEMLPINDTGVDLPTEVTASLCHILLNLSQNETQNVRAIVDQGALPKITNISSKDNGYGPSRAGQAACLLLHAMWKHTELHVIYKRCGYRKADFINARTTKAVNSSRD
ncbi:plakophilin-2 [Aulostomus maculatus]